MVRNFPAGLDAFRSLHGYNTLSTKLGLSSLGALQRAILTFYNDLLDQDLQVNIGVVVVVITNLTELSALEFGMCPAVPYIRPNVLYPMLQNQQNERRPAPPSHHCKLRQIQPNHHCKLRPI